MNERQLRDRIEELEEENRQLRELLKRPLIFPQITGGRVKNEILATLYTHAGKPVNVHVLQAAIPRAEDLFNTLLQHMHQLRRKLTPLGITIETIYRHGYMLDRENAEKLKAFVA